MKKEAKAWKKKLKKIENEAYGKKLNAEIENLKKKQIPAALAVLYGPGYIYSEIALRKFLRARAESLADKKNFDIMDAGIKNLWKLFFASTASWLAAGVVLVSLILKVMLKQ